MSEKRVIEIKHPLIQHKLTIMRKKETSTVKFRSLLQEVSMLLAYEITRDPKTLGAVEYYSKLPESMEDRDVIVVDPMLATGNSAIAAIAGVKETKPKSIKFLCILAAPEGLAAFHEEHPDITVYTAAVDEGIDQRGYILPGLGDAGDRLYGTKLHD